MLRWCGRFAFASIWALVLRLPAAGEEAGDPRASGDPPQRSPEVSWYFGIESLSSYDGLARRTFSDANLPGSSDLSSGVSVAPSRQVSMGLLLNIHRYLELEAAIQAGRAELASEGPPRAEMDAYALGVRLTLRLYPFPDARLRPWLSAGIQSLLLEPRELKVRFEEGTDTFDKPPRRSASDFAVGVGIERPVGSTRTTWMLSSHYAFGHGGWRLGLGLRFAIGQRPRPPRFDLDVDTDRNRTVDDAQDDPQEDEFSPARGAVLLVNIDDDDRLGRSDGDPQSRTVASRFDGEDLGDLHFRHSPGTLQVFRSVALRMTQEAAESQARVLLGPTEVLGPSSGVVRDGYKEFPLSEAWGPEGVTRFWIEGIADEEKLGAATGNFGSAVTVELIERDVLMGPDIPPPTARILDRVHLQVAPWLVLGNLDPALEVLAGAPPIADQLDAILPRIQSTPPLKRISGAGPWLQDQIEIGYSNWPASELYAVADSLISNGAVAEALVAPGVGKFDLDIGINYEFGFGNLEVSPPLEARGREWPFGRIYHGRNMKREIADFLEAQRYQKPVQLDTDWLYVGHVDEMLAFISDPAPGPGKKPFKVLLASPREAIRLLEEASAKGRGGEFFCSRGATIDDILRAYGQRNLDDWQPRIDAALAQMVVEFGLDPLADVIEIPVIFKPDNRYFRATAHDHNMVNLLSLNGHLVVSDPCSKILEEDFLAKLEAIGYRRPGSPGATIHFIGTSGYDAGDIHCLTNVRRAIPKQSTWWTEQ